MSQSAAYRARLMCPDWRGIVCPRIIRRAGGRCERCKRFGHLEIHHLTYERLGHELDSDLEALCDICHPPADKERERQTAIRHRERAAAGEIARHEAGFSTWCERRFGDAAPDDLDFERDKFDAWLERKEESEDYD